MLPLASDNQALWARKGLHSESRLRRRAEQQHTTWEWHACDTWESGGASVFMSEAEQGLHRTYATNATLYPSLSFNDFIIVLVEGKTEYKVAVH